MWCQQRSSCSCWMSNMFCEDFSLLSSKRWVEFLPKVACSWASYSSFFPFFPSFPFFPFFPSFPFKLLLLDNDKILISRQSRRLEEKKMFGKCLLHCLAAILNSFFFFLITLYLSRESPIYGHSLHLSHSLNLPP